MPAEETTAARYRRLAQECLDVAASFPDRDSGGRVRGPPACAAAAFRAAGSRKVHY